MRKIHPGEVLREEYLKPLNMQSSALAAALKLHVSVIEDLVLEKGEITPELAHLLSKITGASAEFWLNLQERFNS